MDWKWKSLIVLAAISVLLSLWISGWFAFRVALTYPFIWAFGSMLGQNIEMARGKDAKRAHGVIFEGTILAAITAAIFTMPWALNLATVLAKPALPSIVLLASTSILAAVIAVYGGVDKFRELKNSRTTDGLLPAAWDQNQARYYHD